MRFISLSSKLLKFTKASRKYNIISKKFEEFPVSNRFQFRSYQNASRVLNSERNSLLKYFLYSGITLGGIYSAINIFAKINQLNAETQESQPDLVINNDAQPEVLVSKTVEDESTINNEQNESEEASEVKTNEIEKPKTMPSYVPYLIVGGGTASMSAFKAIRANDPRAKILIITEENYKPYMRPPLSKDMWSTEDENLLSEYKFKQLSGNERSLFYLENEFYVSPQDLNDSENGGVAVLTGSRVVKIDATSKKVILANNWEINFDKLLIATGGTPKNLKSFEKPEIKEKVTLFRNIDDFQKLRDVAKQGKTIAIIGGGFLGSEISCALAKFGKTHGGSVVQIFPESGNLGKVLPTYLSEWVTGKVKDEGVKIIGSSSIEKVELDENNKVVISLENVNNKNSNDKKWVVADHCVVAVGIEPNVDLGISSDLEIDQNLGGYLVNAELQARNSIWVAGDAACFYDAKLGRRRVEHHDHAVVTGRLAGENMSKDSGKAYTHQSMFWSDLGSKIGFEAIGVIDSSLKTLGVFAQPNEQEGETNLNNDKYNKGIIFYLKSDKIVGVLTWNLFKRMPIARKVLNDHFKVSDIEEISKLFKITYEETNEKEGNK